MFKQLLFIYKFFISLKLAIATLIALAVLTGLGTIVESRYDQEMANKLVYHSIWMSAVWFMLAVNLTMVLIDRWPWKKRQAPFVLAHIGILTLILGSVFTKYFGLDGSIRFEEGESKSSMSLLDMEIKIYSSYDGENFSLIHEEPVDMFFIRPTEEDPYIIQVGGEKFIIDQYFPFAVGREFFKSVSKGAGPALRFHLSGSRASIVEWMNLSLGEKTVSHVFGPALITLTRDKNYKAKKTKELVLLVEKKELFYLLAGWPKKPLVAGQVFSTGWMDLKFHLLEFIPKAQKEFIFESQSQSSDKTVKALRIRHEGKKTWLGQNSYVQFFKKDKLYALVYANKTQPLGFDLELQDFRMTKYQASDKAKTYESQVRLGDQSLVISMNEPFKHKGWIFYQSSFEPNKEGGDPVVSILSVNRDPGRPLKYIGSALIVLGVILLFYSRKLSKLTKA